MAEMTQKELECFKHFITAYKHQWDLNSYMRTNYDEDMEYYCSYRPAKRYPLAYNEPFNKLLPKTMTILSKMMSQIYQAGTGDLVSVRPRKKADVDRAPRVQGLLDFQLENLNSIDMMGGSYLFNFQWMFNAVNFGKGIAKLYWRKEERIAPRRVSVPSPKFNNVGQLVGIEMIEKVVEDMQVVYDGPYAEVIHPKLFVPHPYYKSIQKMPFIFCVYSKPIDHIKRLADKGIYKNVDKLGWSGTSGHGLGDSDSAEAYSKSIEIEGAMSLKELQTEYISPNVDIIEGYGRYIFPEDETPYEVGSGMKIKGKESEAIVHIGNYKTILSIQKNKYEYRPFFDIGAYYHPEMYWDIGVIRLGKGVQELHSTLANTRVQNTMMLVNQMLKVREEADIDPQALVWKPYGIIPVEDMNDIEPLVTPDVSQTGAFREQEQFFDNVLQEITGMYNYGMGQTPDRQEHVGTIYSLQAVGEARTKLLLMTMDHTGFRPFLKYMMLLNLWHLPQGFEARINTNEGQQFTPLWPQDIHADYDFSARYTGMEPALGKQFKAQQLIQYAQMWEKSPYLQHHQFMKAILELMDFHDSDRYLKSPQQLQQEQMQQQQQMLAGAMVQDQLAAKEQNRELTRDIVKGLMS